MPVLRSKKPIRRPVFQLREPASRAASANSASVAWSVIDPAAGPGRLYARVNSSRIWSCVQAASAAPPHAPAPWVVASITSGRCEIAIDQRLGLVGRQHLVRGAREARDVAVGHDRGGRRAQRH